MFTIKFWHTGAVQALTGLFAALATYLVITGQVPAWTLILWFLAHQTLTGFGAIGAHSLFCHATYKTNAFWEKFLAYGGTLLCIGSPIQWAAGHTAHHDYSDTDQDPHNAKTWRGLFLGRYNRPHKYSFRFARDLVAKPWHVWLHRYALVVPLSWSLFLIIAGMLSMPSTWYIPILFGYLAPLFTALTAGAIHNVVSHDKNGPRDMPWMLLFMPWEWSHGSHHEDPKNPNKAWKHKWFPDPSYWVIRSIRTD